MNILKSAAASFILIALASGCSSTHPLIADKSVLVSPGLHVSHQALAGAAIAGAVVWYVVDPLAPTWGIARRKLAQDRYRIDLRQKRFAVGGDGEARQVFHRAAETLAEENGYSGYTIVSYTEGLESGPLLGQRVSRGVVLLTRTEEAARDH
ncbi:MAG: hypothetical protein HY067_02755 [Betaproteobacteria bacterium]|nr:hypothetical protein [Betaproteobacteria bacterium]